MENLLQDIRYALRTLRRSPAFTTIAVLSLGLGIGANTTIFSAASAMLARELPVARPDRLVRVYRNHHSPHDWRDFSYFRDNNTVFSDLIGERLAPFAFAIGAGSSEQITGSMVTGSYFSALGVRPVLGRVFVGQPTQAPGTLQEAVLSYRFWEQRFGGDSSIIGRTIRINNAPMTVVGVADERFTSSVFGWRPELWVPLTESRAISNVELQEFGGSLYTTARLKDGVDFDRAQAEMNTLMSQLKIALPEEHERMTITLEHALGINAEMRTPVVAASGALMVVTALVLLIACANVANLLLSRATSRQREVAVRLAVGAGRGRLVRQLLTESVLLALAGGVVGLLIAMWATDLLASFLPADQPVTFDLSPDSRVLWYSLLLSVGTGIVFGLAPALRASNPNLITSLRDAQTTKGYQRSRLRSGLVVSQVLLCTVLLAGAALFLHSLLEARVMKPGFETRNILDLAVDVRTQQYAEDKGIEFYRQLRERAEAIPGVEVATIQAVVPLGGSNMETRVNVAGKELGPDERPPSSHFNTVGPRYFETFRVPLVRGREFTERDRAGAPAVVIVNETLARRLWPNEDALGKRISFSGPEGPFVEVVGIAKNHKYVTLGEAPRSFMYLPHAQNYRSEMVVHVRTAGNSAVAGKQLAELVRSMDPSLPVGAVKPLSDDLKIALMPAQAGAGLLGTFGFLALVLSTIGIYGVTAYSVSQRTQEIGIRTALGAQRRDVLRLVLGDSMKLVAIGAVLGLLGALGVGRAVASLLYGVSPADPLTFIGTPLVLASVALLASYIPARRAARVDPMIALRYE